MCEKGRTQVVNDGDQENYVTFGDCEQADAWPPSVEQIVRLYGQAMETLRMATTVPEWHAVEVLMKSTIDCDGVGTVGWEFHIRKKHLRG